jgi:N-acetylgalactosamine-6-sulfatase
MNHNPIVSFALTSVLAFAAVPLLRSAPAERPNIVILFADDMGYGDLSSYDCPDIKTPVIDGIGERGLRFTQFYSNSPMCSPSRTALLTGRYQQRVGGLECAIGTGNVGLYDEAVWLQQRGELGLPASETTIAEMLRRAGYDTAIIGKWHLGYERKFWPDNHGFQESFVALGGNLDYMTHTERDGTGTLVHNGERIQTTGYLTDVFADRAIEWISQRRAPYFLYLPFTAPHGPLRAPDHGPSARSPDDKHRDTYRKMVEHMDRRIGDILRPH